MCVREKRAGCLMALVPYTGGGCSASEMPSRGLFGVVSRQRPGMDVAGTNKTSWTGIVGMISSKLSRFRNTGRQSENVAAINGPITRLLLPKGEKVQ